jgi:hypothetical protein
MTGIWDTVYVLLQFMNCACKRFVKRIPALRYVEADEGYQELGSVNLFCSGV